MLTDISVLASVNAALGKPEGALTGFTFTGGSRSKRNGKIRRCQPLLARRFVQTAQPQPRALLTRGDPGHARSTPRPRRNCKRRSANEQVRCGAIAAGAPQASVPQKTNTKKLDPQ